MLWALIMQPQTQYTQHVQETFRLTMASMDMLLSDNKPAQIIMSFKDKKFLLCTLQKDKVWQVPLNLIVEKGSVITFSCNGASYIHLTGYVKINISKQPKEDNWVKFFFKQIMDKNITELKNEYIAEMFDYLKKHNAKGMANWIAIYRPSLNKETEDQSCKEQGTKKKHAPTDEARGSKRLKYDNNCERTNESNSNENTKESDDVDDNCQDDESSSDEECDDSSTKDENVDVEMQESKEEKSGERNKNEADDNCQDDESSSDEDCDDSSTKDENVDVEMQESKEEKFGERNKNDVDDNCQDDESSSDDDCDDSSTKDENVDVEMQESKEEKSGDRNKNEKRQGKREITKIEEKFKGGKDDKTNGEEKQKYTIINSHLKTDFEVEVIRSGTGDRMAKKGDNVTTYYVARMMSENHVSRIYEYEKGLGFRFKLGARSRQALRDVDMGVVGMKIGEKRRLTMSYRLAYDIKGSLLHVPPFATIVYDIELKEIDNYD
ncbi:PREDICTED: 46 kDa FK506-binding nuclear protein-like isoform X2 [Wasmannia auropunctata]|uniref:46 kDa FK506-binding nuclear protein-like isoform X2 n=1 Tax=Wasmannia auropunctata TaxID=64793 RepID=UPI0005F03F66|nr:PREDICTED: 46 kDa FK506-binding nuclear protein-like isoform X2 [Wasmannia auropunctata]